MAMFIGFIGFFFLSACDGKIDVMELSEMIQELYRLHCTCKDNKRIQEYISHSKADAVLYVMDYVDMKELELELGESFIDFLGYVPLVDVMDIKMKPAWSTTKELSGAVRRMEEIPGVAEVVWQAGLLKQIEDAIQRLLWPLIGLALLFLIAAIALINNTIRLTVYARRFTIKTMQLVGAHPSAIRLPFIKQGLIVGLISGSLAFAAINGILSGMKIQNASLMEVFTPTILAVLWGMLLFLGAFLGGISTAIAVNRFLRKRLDTLH
jgi:cell division transport system permease protein